MNSESYQIETRRRSRSKTPFLRSSCDHENCEHAGEEGHVHHTKKKTSATPNVQTIIEEKVKVSSSSTTKAPTKSSNIVELTIGEQLMSSARTQRTTQGRKGIATTASSSAAAALADVMTTSSEGSSSATTVTKTTSQTIVTKTKKSSGGGGPTISTSTPKELNYGNKLFEEKRLYNESTQNVLNSVQEKQQLQQEQKEKHSTLLSFYNSFIGNKSTNNTGNGDANADHIAYEYYKRAGEYWNVTPKTDYTYSELSPHRRELAPGVVAMPNMSRRSLENHSQRVNFMVARNPSQEQYIRRRYEADYASQRREATNLNYDSTDEVDITQFGNQRRHQYADTSETSWFMRIITTIVTTITSVYSKVTGGGGGDAAYQEDDYYRRIYGRQQQQQKLGFIGSIYHGITSGVLSLCRYVYMFISSVLLLDTILLKSSNADNKRKKRFLILLLILLPLLLLAGTYYYLHPNESFPPKSFNDINLALPELPKIDMNKILNQEKYNALKTETIGHLVYVRDWADEYLLYLKTISQNVYDQGRKLFRSDEVRLEPV